MVTDMEEPFVTHRNLLFTAAYQILGSAVEAEDVVQETWLRWAGVPEVDRAEVKDLRAYLVTITSRLALNRLRTLTRRREEYFGEWLPEPLLTSPDVADDVTLAESVSFALLAVLETLGPAERVVFVLREVFDTPYEEIASTLERTPEAVRQIAHRARGHVAARRPRMEVGRNEHQEVVERFLASAREGDVTSLMEVLAPEVVLVADGGGKVPAASRPVRGAEKVAAALKVLSKHLPKDLLFTRVWVNGAPSGRFELDGQTVATVSLTIEDGLITGIYSVSNPDKLSRLQEPVMLTRGEGT
jgi:RNA polymerase sigma-70 factor (TIGR02957 family)